MESKTRARGKKKEAQVKLEKKMADLSTVSPVKVTSISVEKKPPPRVKAATAASDVVTKKASGKDSGNVAHEKKTKRKRNRNSKSSNKSVSGAVEEEKKEDPLTKFDNVTSDLYHDFFKFLAFGQDGPHNEQSIDYIESTYSDLTTSDRAIAFKILIEMIEDNTPFFCSFCSSGPFQIMFTAQQTIMHIGSHEHIEKINFSASLSRLNAAIMNVIGTHRVDEIFDMEEEQVRRQRKIWRQLNLKSHELRPLEGPIEGIDDTIDRFFLRRLRAAESPSKILHLQVADRMVKTLRRHDGGLMLSLADHIGKAKTRCLPCKLIFADSTEYYEHLITYYHVSRVDAYDTLTVLVNAQEF